MAVITFPLQSITRTFTKSSSTHNHLRSLTRLSSTLSAASTMAPRTYDSALAHLSLLQSNRAITSLFAPASSTSSEKPKTKQELNALAIPEVLTWLSRAGLSQERLANLKCIHVAGTKGKGSVCAYLTSILTRAGDDVGRVGTYTSPHLVSVRERIQLDGRPISQSLFARYFFEVWDAFTESARAEAARLGKEAPPISDAELEGPATKPFYFRFLTIMAFRVFLEQGVRSAVIECGIGGEYDSTNVLPPDAVTAGVISQLGIDHVGMLGSTLPEIAWHKAGICKEGRKFFTRRLEYGEGDTAQRTMQVLRERAAEKGAVLVEVNDREVETWGGVRGDGSLEGEFQKYNQALAATAAREHLRVLAGNAEPRPAGGLASLPGFFLDGLRQAGLRGRCETREDGNITWFIDGAHTAESLDEVGKWFAQKRRALPGATRTVLLFNQQERDAAALLHRLHNSVRGSLQTPPKEAIFDEAIFTRNEPQGRNPGGDEPERDLAVQKAGADAMRGISPDTATVVLDNVADAVAKVRSVAESSSRDGSRVAVLVTGSLHLVGPLLRTLEPESEL